MLVQLGFESGFFNASLGVIRQLDGDLFVLRASKYRFGDEDPFARRDLDAAAGVTGVASVVPLYASWQSLFWKEPGGDKSYLVQAFARSEEHTSELQSRFDLVCRLLLEKKKKNQ